MNPGTPPAERQRLLTSIVVGGGPTGVEFAAELCDLIEQDFRRLYPPELIRDAKVVLVQSSDHILNTYDLRISQYAERQFQRHGIRVVNNHQVIRVTEETVECLDKTGKVRLELPRGLCVWATGIRMIPLVRRLTGQLPEQVHDRALIVNDWLRVKGMERIFAMGDCATIELPNLLRAFQQSSELAAAGETLQYAQLLQWARQMLIEDPQLQVHMALFASLARKHSTPGGIPRAMVHRLLQEVEANLRSLPATAQAARQEGKYLADFFNHRAKLRLASDVAAEKPSHAQQEQSYPSFAYHHAGMSAYIGSKRAVFDFGRGQLADRYLAFWLWKSVYLSEQVSYRTRFMVAVDWIKTFLFGRDVSNPA